MKFEAVLTLAMMSENIDAGWLNWRINVLCYFDNES